MDNDVFLLVENINERVFERAAQVRIIRVAKFFYGVDDLRFAQIIYQEFWPEFDFLGLVCC